MSNFSSIDNNLLEYKSNQIRKTIFETAINSGKGHIPCAFSWVEIGVSIYYGNIFNLNKNSLFNKERDKFILSKGHACLTQYAILADLGFFEDKLLDKYAKGGSILAGHPDIEIPGIETCTGSLGHGIGVCSGLAFSAKLSGSNSKNLVLLGDAECHEGSVWEALMFSSQQKLGNLIAIIDKNGLGATDRTEKYGSLEPLNKRLNSFGWDTVEIDGHNYSELLTTFEYAQNKPVHSSPTCIIANTTKGKGVSFMENSKNWHHQMPNEEQIALAKHELGIKI